MEKTILSVVQRGSGNSLQERKLEKIDFAKGIAALIAAFSGLVIPVETAAIWYDLLSDLTKEEFFRGLAKFCKFQKEIYPGTNVPAHIRDFAGKGQTLSNQVADYLEQKRRIDEQD